MESGLAFEEKAFLSAERLTVWWENSAEGSRFLLCAGKVVLQDVGKPAGI